MAITETFINDEKRSSLMEKTLNCPSYLNKKL